MDKSLKIKIFAADHTAYSKKLNKVVMMRDAPGHGKDDFVILSGTKVRAMLAAGEDLSSVDYVDIIDVEEMKVGDADALTLQATDFLNSVRTGSPPEIDAEAGSMAIRTAERIVEKANAAGAKMV